MVLLICTRKSARVAPAGFPLRSSRDCKTNYSIPFENWDMIKIFGMVYCYLPILKGIILSPRMYGSAKDSFTSLGLLHRDLVTKLVTPILSSKRCLKNFYQWMRTPNIQLWCEDEVHFQRHASFIRMRLPRSTSSCAFCFNTSESGVLRSPQFENRMPACQRSLDLQHQDLCENHKL